MLNDETLAKVVFVLKNAESFKGAITKAKEVAKNKLLGKLDLEPRLKTPAGSNNDDALHIDMDALSRPAKIR